MAEPNAWTDLLRAHLRAAGAREPIPAREALSELEEQQCRILGGHLIRWLEEHGPRQMQALEALPVLGIPARGRLLIYVTDTPGLVAAREIVGDDSDGFVACRESELSSFSDLAKDRACRFHFELHSYFERLPARDARSERRKRRTENGEYWVHHTSSVVAENIGEGVDHLWRWDGTELELAEEAFGVRVY